MHLLCIISSLDNGDTLAIGTIFNDANGADSGLVKVFLRDPDSTLGWVQVGNDLEGTQAYYEFGHSISLSGNGEVLAVGTPSRSAANGNGQTKVFIACAGRVSQFSILEYMLVYHIFLLDPTS